MGGMTFWTFLFDVFVIFMFVLWIVIKRLNRTKVMIGGYPSMTQA